jgi:hypothetical protein
MVRAFSVNMGHNVDGDALNLFSDAFLISFEGSIEFL